MRKYIPIEGAISEVAFSLVGHAICDADEYTGWGEDAVDFWKHCLWVGAGAIATEDRVKGSFVNDGIERSIFKLERFDIHLFVNKIWTFLLI